ncbi:hypothetical protein DPMN_132293 [Dreissena polymorpha]|uniref:Uncharacterized protein n=1 Tax=Dreissena polymorpha TaxID=45954 RepID=A0A9D4JBY1_DREPO|nr:hypothetical protein DPMN_132293 [Dreissena polymorpha]
MGRERRSKQKHTTRKDRNKWKTAQDVAYNLTDDNEFSNTLSRILNECAVNEHLIQFRRERQLFFEREQTFVNKAFGLYRHMYIFGSQIEGTTTLGMMSDIDCLIRYDTFLLYLESENPPLHTHDQQVVLKVGAHSCSSQYCVLTMNEPSKQTMRFRQLNPNQKHVDLDHFFRCDWTQNDGKVPNTVMFILPYLTPSILQHAKRHGPAEGIGDIEYVHAFYCESIPKQCKFVFGRPRPGHWPSEKTLKKAKKYGVFIVPQGSPKRKHIR